MSGAAVVVVLHQRALISWLRGWPWPLLESCNLSRLYAEKCTTTVTALGLKGPSCFSPFSVPQRGLNTRTSIGPVAVSTVCDSSWMIIVSGVCHYFCFINFLVFLYSFGVLIVTSQTHGADALTHKMSHTYDALVERDCRCCNV